MDNFTVLIVIVSFLVQIAIVGGIIYVVYAFFRRGRNSDSERDEGRGSLKQVYFYGISFAALMALIAGISLAVQSLLNVLFDNQTLSASSSNLAWGLSLFIVGLPIWAFHWRTILRNIAEMPVERRSIIRKLYMYLTLAVSLGFLMGTSFEIMKWAMLAGEFPEFSLASILPWAMVWGYHWQIETEEGQRSVETRGIRRLYLYGAALVGGGMFAVGVGAIVHTLLKDGYSALFLVPVTLSEQTGLVRESLRSDLAVAVAGGAVYWTHWYRFASGERDSFFRWVFVFLTSVGGVATALASGGVIVYTTLSWLLGAATERAALHFEDMPGALVVASVGVVVWAMFRRRMLDEATGEYTEPIRRIYDHLMAALGLAALAGASFVVFNTALVVFADSLSTTMRDSDAWRSPVASILTMLAIGIPVWGFHWRRLRQAAYSDPEAEATALSHRVYVFAVMGAGALALLGGGGGTLFVILRDLLDAEMSVDTIRDLTPVLGTALTAALFLPYHWGIYRAGQAFQPESPPEESPTVRKRVTILSADDGSALTEAIEESLGYPVREAHWSDMDAFTPALDEEEAARIADEISQSGGSNVLLIPDAAGLRVISYD